MFATQHRDIQDILSQPYYFVDKSIFIKHFLEDPSRITIFLRPRLMGKSVNASMLAAFCASKMQTPVVTGFHRLLKINRKHKYSGIVKGYGERYGIIWIDWAASKVLEASDAIEFEAKMARYMTKLLREMIEMLGIPEKHLSRKIPKDVDLGKLLTSESMDDSCQTLGLMAHLYGLVTENQVIIIMDDYDKIYKKAADIGCYSETVEFLKVLFSEAIRIGHNQIWKIAAFGVHAIKNDGPFEECFLGNRPPSYSFLGSADKYQLDFGFTKKDVDKALREFPTSGLSYGDLESWYQVVPESDDKLLLQAYSVASAIKHGSLDEYFTRVNPINLYSYPFNRMNKNEFGPGNLIEIAHEPHLSHLKWPLQPIPVDYDPENSNAYLNISHLLSWLHSEGYAFREELGSREMVNHLKRASMMNLNLLTNIIPAFKSLRGRNEGCFPSTEAIKNSLEALFSLPNYMNGLGAREQPKMIVNHITLLFRQLFPEAMGWSHEGSHYRVYETGPRDHVVVVLEFSGNDPSLEYLEARLKMSKVATVDSHRINVLICVVDTEGKAKVSFKTITRAIITITN